MALTAEEVCFAYDRIQILKQVSFALGQGEWLTILGPNGGGKTTLLRCLMGLIPLTRGQICLERRSLAGMSRWEIARHMALLPQHSELPFGFTVREIVAMGRTPHLGRFRPMTGADQLIVDGALEATDTLHLADRPVNQLSGGEAQRVYLARAFAQDTPILVLDEPTTNLDLFHERTLLDQVRRRKEQGVAVLAVLHDLNLAARYSDRILILSEGKVATLGTPREALRREIIQAIFRVEPVIQIDAESNQLRIWT